MKAVAQSRQHGFSLIELSVVIAVLGVMTFAVTAGFENVQGYRLQKQAQADAQTAHAAVRAFVLRNRRLPCPDSSSTGTTHREPTGSCLASAGWLPYESLGLPPPRTTARMRYGIYIHNGINLAEPKTIAANELDPDGSGALLHTLAELASVVDTPTTSAPHYATNAGNAGTPACTSADITNPAFVIIAPASDLTGDGNHFELVNRSFSNGPLCTSAPSRKPDATVDDFVIAESPNALLGWLTASIR